jgi:NADPH-dependent 2,4-dienoyl-CoA reductase/sulfur reductase-like enzyme
MITSWCDTSKRFERARSSTTVPRRAARSVRPLVAGGVRESQVMADDVVVVGGGVIGCACALALAATGLGVADGHPHPGAGPFDPARLSSPAVPTGPADEPPGTPR